MTVKFSPQKVTKILRNYFLGLIQSDIAEKAKVDQSTVSIYSSRFKNRVIEVGLLPAGKEFNVFDQVDSLRSLSVELSKADLSVEEAKEGFNIMKTFIALGIPAEQHRALVEVCGKISDPGFVQAALKLKKIEKENNMGYEELVSRFEKVSSELPAVEDKLKGKQSDFKSLSDLITNKNEEMTNLKTKIAELQKDAKTIQIKLEEEFETKKRGLNIKAEEIKEVAKLKADLGKQGLDISTLARLAKEYTHGSPKG